MSISVADNFSYQGTKPLDARIKFDTVANMKAYAENSLYDGCLAYVTGTKTYYTYDSTNTVDVDTGRWRELSTGGGGGASALKDLTDTDITSPANGDVLKYDSTNDEWINSPITSVNDEELTLAEYNDLPQAQKMNGKNYFITDGNSSPTVFSVQKNILAAGSTTTSFTIPTTGDPLLTCYSSDPNVQYLSANTSVSGVVTYTFPAQSSAMNVYLKIEVL